MLAGNFQTMLRGLTIAAWLGLVGVCSAQNIQRYLPLDIGAQTPPVTDLPREPMPAVAGDDRVLVEALRAVVIVDQTSKVSTDKSIDDLRGLNFDFEQADSLVFSQGVRRIIDDYLDQPITLRRINELAGTFTCTIASASNRLSTY